MRNERINQFRFKGISSADMGIIITNPPKITGAERDEEFISVPGRSGDIICDNGRFGNTSITYETALLSDDRPLDLIAKKIKAWLQGQSGYYRLSDTYDPNYYRMAAYSGKIDIEDKMQKIGLTTLQFSCKPFKYRTDGENAFEITTASALYNPEEWESLPYIKIIGNGDITLSINNNSYGFTDVSEYIEIDSEIQNCCKGTALQNSKTSFISFPKLSPGRNEFAFTGNVSKIIVVPRWCTL